MPDSQMVETLNAQLKVIKLEFKEFCSSLYNKQINELFSSAGFTLPNENFHLMGLVGNL
ncbi:MAG: hypothetical protein N5P05_004652 (plasmid) [Chroococcopsis gigantea SAG 12.99]|nr:hypothetical protein [Chroococcopsis gigantea SAG 12.99]